MDQQNQNKRTYSGNAFWNNPQPTSTSLPQTPENTVANLPSQPSAAEQPKPVDSSSTIPVTEFHPVITSDKKSNTLSKKTGVIIGVIAAAMVVVVGTVIAIVMATGSPMTANDQSIVATQVVPQADVSEDSNANSVTVKDSDYILMPNCKNKKYSAVKAQLEEMGLKIKESYEFSDEVEKDYVIYQMNGEGSHLQKGDTVSLTISKGSDKCPYDYEQKLTVTATGGSSYATAVLYEWKEGDWSKIATYDATVGSNGIGNTREGSSTSPKGVHKLGVVLSSSSVSTNMDTYTATSNTCVIDDTESSYYNQIMEKSSVPSDTHYDNIGKGLTNGSTYATIYIEHNGSGFSSKNVVSGNGSAIGLRGQNGTLSPTYGDVDISASDMRDLLSKLDYNKNPVIELKTK